VADGHGTVKGAVFPARMNAALKKSSKFDTSKSHKTYILQKAIKHIYCDLYHLSLSYMFILLRAIHQMFINEAAYADCTISYVPDVARGGKVSHISWRTLILSDRPLLLFRGCRAGHIRGRSRRGRWSRKQSSREETRRSRRTRSVRRVASQCRCDCT
jgi:hypothetical protein